MDQKSALGVLSAKKKNDCVVPYNRTVLYPDPSVE